MEKFENSMSQSNPMFGKCIYRSNQRDMAEHGYITPLQAIILNQLDNKTNDLVNTSEDEVERLNYFIYDLIDALHDLDKRIVVDSKGRRHAFMFVTVNGNKFLQTLLYSDYFNNIINSEHIGVYMTSSPTNYEDKNGNRNYYGGAYIKKAESDRWSNVHPKINDFIDIINGKAENSYPELNLTTEEIHTHMNLLINIDQCNTGVNLPGMNGVYFGRFFDKNNPLVVQIPGRVCRPDKEDIPILGNIETAAYSPECKYVKPFAYLYLPAGLFTEEEFELLKETLELTYYQNAMEKVTYINTPHGLGNNDEPENSNKDYEEEPEMFKTVNRPDWKTISEKLDLLKDIKYGDIFDKQIELMKIYTQLDELTKEKYEELFSNLTIPNSRYELADMIWKCKEFKNN